MKRILVAVIAIAVGAALGWQTRENLAAAYDELAGQYDQTRPIVIGTSPGGGVLDFMENYEKIRRTKRPVRIEGICISACTFVTGWVPRERVCVEMPFAKLAFHSASQYTIFGRMHSSEGTRLIWQIYPEQVRAMLRAKGWDGDPPGLVEQTAKDREERLAEDHRTSQLIQAGQSIPKKTGPVKAKQKRISNEHDDLIYIGGEELLEIFKAC